MDNEKIKAIASEKSAHAVDLRHQIHRHPELADQEFETCALIKRELTRLNIEHHGYENSTAVVGIIRGKEGGKTVALRADIDALPIEERTNLPFASQNKGVMHACGHDAHAAILLGTAAVLQEMKNSFTGNVKLFFQPAEEGDGGAKKMIQWGCMEHPKVEEVYGLHVSSGKEVGTVAAKAGVIYAFSDDFEIIIRGKKAHGAHPEGGIDAVYVAAHVITAIHALPGRRVSANDAITLNVGAIHGGAVHNVVCDEVHLRLMFRTLKRETRERMAQELTDMIHGICAAHGATAEVNRTMCCDSQENEEYLVERLRSLSAGLLGEDAFTYVENPSMGTEDFCFFGQAAPSIYYNLGAGRAPGHERAPGHSSEFTINDGCIEAGMIMQTAMAIDGLNRLNGEG